MKRSPLKSEPGAKGILPYWLREAVRTACTDIVVSQVVLGAACLMWWLR